MLTINEIRNHFNIDGAIKVMKYHYDAPVNEEYELLYEQEYGTSYKIPDKYCHIEINYMYAEDGFLVIELREY